MKTLLLALIVAAAPVDDSFRTQKPAPGPTPKLALPPVKTFVDPTTGLNVFLVERKDLPVVTWTLAFDTGGVDDPKGKEGLAQLAMALTTEGTKRLDKIAFEERQADLGSSVSSGGGLETSTVTFRSLSRNADETLSLFVESLREPGLRVEDFDRLKKRMKADLQQQRGAPASIGARVAPVVLYGPTHPYGRIVTDASIDAITLDDVRGYLARLAPKGARLYVVGDADEARVKAQLAAKLGGWKGTAPKPLKIAKPAPLKGTVFFVDVPGAPQSQIAIGAAGPSRLAKDYEANLLLAQILGGGFSSRLNMNLREKHGFTYGARAGFSYRRALGAFTAATSVRTDATGASLREIAKEIRAMRAGAPTPMELARERQGVVLGLPAQFATGDRIQQTIGELAFYGLPLDWYAEHANRLAAVDEAAILAAAKKHLVEEGYKVLVVGDGKAVLPELQAIAKEGVFGKEGVVLLDADGNVVPSSR